MIHPCRMGWISRDPKVQEKTFQAEIRKQENLWEF